MKAPEKEWMQDILDLPFPVLIEADGSRRLPVKVPGERSRFSQRRRPMWCMCTA